jgi:demethylmenaquinone methyltransferase/2-methoxy-6-polyprenyl-1,4-benzoquinol methylase
VQEQKSQDRNLPQLGSGAMFDSVANRYDLLNRIISLGVDKRWRRRTVRSLPLYPGSRVLDLATGTGDLAIDIAKRHPGTQVVGVDPSENMLEVGRGKIAKLGLTDRIEMKTGIGEDLPFEDDVFDAVTIAFGIRNCTDRAQALREMARVTRPGGKIAILELNEPSGSVFSPFARFHVHHVVPRLGALLSGSREYRYLQKSIAAFPPASEFAALMEECGLKMEELVPFSFGSCHLYVASVPEKSPSGAN